MGETAIGGDARDFPQTRWTLIVSSRDNPQARQTALQELLTSYWKPLYYYVRRKGRTIDAAKDAIQGFFAHLLQNDFLSRLDPGRGRFRGFLRTSIDNYLNNLYESQSAQKRGGGAKNVGLDFDVAERNYSESTEPADAAYDREWAVGVMQRAMTALRSEFEGGKRKGPFDLVLRFFDVTRPAPSYEDAAKQSGMTVGQFKAFLHRARERFRELVKIEVAHTVSDSADIDAEMAQLMRALKS